MSDIVVYGVPGSPYTRSALLDLEEKGAAYRLVRLPSGANRSEEHLRRHPFGRIPILDHGQFRLYETQAILRYIDSALPGPALQPRDQQAAARMNQIVGIVDWYVFPQISVRITAERFMFQAFWGRPTDEAVIAKALPEAHVCLRALEQLKGTADFLAGDAVSIADLMLVPHLAFFRMTAEGAAMLQETSLDAWLDRMSARASMQATEAERLKQVA